MVCAKCNNGKLTTGELKVEELQNFVDPEIIYDESQEMAELLIKESANLIDQIKALERQQSGSLAEKLTLVVEGKV